MEKTLQGEGCSFVKISMKRDTASPLAKLQPCMGILMVSFKATDKQKILHIKNFSQSQQKSLEVRAFERGDLGLVDVLWLHGFSPVWFYEVRGEKKNSVWSPLCFICLPELL